MEIGGLYDEIIGKNEPERKSTNARLFVTKSFKARSKFLGVKPHFFGNKVKASGQTRKEVRQ
ncbi:hypothetical protein pdam_00025128 [Pocillopora damicornis]|uniref:Uncharacterized protein n=1 Tax=Pocillopora damicornis TaxID=46731 RepID=A0A3M6TRL0_POCDA|nr:hypothetical protein pdam_00025128 [Pocillopora damicornis]